MSFFAFLCSAIVFIVIFVTMPGMVPPVSPAEIEIPQPLEVLVASEEVVSLAPHYSKTRIHHPDRKMTEQERNAWIRNYYTLGGMNAQEIELYNIINEIRASYDLPPFILCPKLSYAARLFSYLQVRYHSVGHTDPHYGGLMERSNFFGAFGQLYMENANSQQWTVSPDGEITYIYLSPQQLADGWMSSEPHREHILTPYTTHAGFGIDSGKNRVVPTMKTIMPREMPQG
jgi:uncharacterized protein YkwD